MGKYYRWPKQAKNVIATANLNYNGTLVSSSSRGPASDGRIKPDIAAHGNGQISTDPNNIYNAGSGTSAAAPGISGVLATTISSIQRTKFRFRPRIRTFKSLFVKHSTRLWKYRSRLFLMAGELLMH